MRRRDFIAGLAGAAAWPLAASAQQPERMRRIGVLMSLAADDPESSSRLTAFVQGLQELGWSDGRNVRIDIRWGAGVAEEFRKYAAELVALAPDILVAVSTPSVAALQHATRNVPIVFVQVVDPVGSGFVETLARPGGSTTGFTVSEYSASGKWLELLKEIAPGTTRAVVLRDPSSPIGTGQFGALQAAAASSGVELRPVNARDVGDIERAIAASARGSNVGLIVLPGGLVAVRRDLIIALAARHRLPATYPFRYYVASGGLISYGPDTVAPHRLAAGYVDRILKGEKPADLPVQVPTKFEMVLNLKTAKAIGLTIPETLLATADEVIQ